ncbi:MAG: carboxylesterase family protein [Phenylobacterium sp.]|uniref:carboxylesterase/lipase family protein n=1 Tax=Phenylobacterium sp. TaxID=1871053 RepID=UPI001A4F12BB|nr:carboxylesterase family protein [Phenylobacterium sp.]MBL8772764.1 carboxylesterase family protein [Phenylobacterium sp.]
MIRRTVAALVALGLAVAPLAAWAQAPQAYQPPSAAPAGEPVTLKIRQGSLKGARADGVDHFYAIPFAPPPVGDLRWRPPGAAPTWTGARDATKAPPSCQMVEDCLYLNVVRPAGAKPGAKLPVIVWIHGSAFRVGQAIGAFGADTEGTEFAKKGVIVVGVNHRLGRAGWFAHPALSREPGLTANYGNMDQIAGLKWVKANIAAFGGDPGNVTAVGESAGAMSILNMMISPEARGLFQKAVVESGFARTEPTPRAEAEANGLKLAQAAGVTGDGPEAAAALRRLPLSALAGSGGGVTAPGRPFPMMDGRLYVETVISGFRAGRQMKIPLIIGGTSNEASLTRPTAAMFDALPADRREAILKVFDPQGSGDKGRVINDLVTVSTITEPDRALARLHAKAGNPTWLFYFSYVPAAERARKPYGAGHVDEVRFVFGQPRARFAPEDLPLTEAMNAYWANFARTGSPGQAAGVTWPRFDLADERQIEFGAEGPQPRSHFQKAWRDYVEAGAR